MKTIYTIDNREGSTKLKEKNHSIVNIWVTWIWNIYLSEKADNQSGKLLKPTCPFHKDISYLWYEMIKSQMKPYQNEEKENPSCYFLIER